MSQGARSKARPWVSVYFKCCHVYQRVYRNREGSAYVGWCPRCLRRLAIRIDPTGTACRSFTAE